MYVYVCVCVTTLVNCIYIYTIYLLIFLSYFIILVCIYINFFCCLFSLYNVKQKHLTFSYSKGKLSMRYSFMLEETNYNKIFKK